MTHKSPPDMAQDRQGINLENRLQQLASANLLAWSGRRLGAAAPVAPVRTVKTVAELLLEDLVVILYLDASALVKRYVSEPGSGEVLRWIEDAEALAG